MNFANCNVVWTMSVSDGEGFGHTDVVFHSRNCFLCAGMWGLKGGGFLGRGEASSLLETGKPIFNSGPECGEMRFAPWLMATPSSKGLFLNLMNAAHKCCPCIALYNTVCVFLLCRLQINHMKMLHHLHSFLSLLAWSWTISSNLLICVYSNFFYCK